MDQIEDNDGMSKSSMLSLKELVDLFASPPAQQGEEQSANNNISGNPESPIHEKNNSEGPNFAPTSAIDPNSKRWLQPPECDEMKKDSSEEGPEFQHDDKGNKTKSIIKKEHRSPNQTKSVHWGDNTICEFQNNSILATEEDLHRTCVRKRSRSETVRVSTNELQLSIPQDGTPKKKRERSAPIDKKCQCSIF